MSGKSGKYNKAHEICKKELKSFISKNQAQAQWFMTPVDHKALMIPQYPEIVKFPMDFGTIQKRLQKSNFTDFDQFASDVTLVFANAILFNPPDHAVHLCALHLKGVFAAVYYRLLANPVVLQWTYPNVPPARGLQAPMLQDHNSKCQQMIGKICGMALSEAFRDPVDWFAQDLAQYPREVGRLMDLGYIGKWLDKNEYASPDLFARDVRQVFKNAMKFNQEGSNFHQMASACATFFEELYNSSQFPRPASVPNASSRVG